MFSNWSKENFVNKNIKNTVPWTYAKTDLKGAEIVWTFYEKGLQKKKIIKKSFRVENVINVKGDKLYAK